LQELTKLIYALITSENVFENTVVQW